MKKLFFVLFLALSVVSGSLLAAKAQMGCCLEKASCCSGSQPCCK
jgi:nucleoside permease NupC